MLSDEEKEALEILNNTEWDGFMITIKNLIEKQQKEIEELKKYEEGYKLLSYSLDNYISKDKIKAKIEEYEKALNIILQKDEWIEPGDTIIRNKFIHYIEFGQSLLEKE